MTIRRIESSTIWNTEKDFSEIVFRKTREKTSNYENSALCVTQKVRGNREKSKKHSGQQIWVIFSPEISWDLTCQEMVPQVPPNTSVPTPRVTSLETQSWSAVTQPMRGLECGILANKRPSVWLTATLSLPVAGVHIGGGELLEDGAAVNVCLAVQHGVARPVLNIEDHPDLGLLTHWAAQISSTDSVTLWEVVLPNRSWCREVPFSDRPSIKAGRWDILK